MPAITQSSTQKSTQDLKLYDAQTIETLAWPNSPSAQLVKQYWLPMMRAGASSQFINNVETQLLLLVIDDVALPITVNQQAYENAYVCSFYSHYITYAKDELTTLKFPALESVLALLLTVVGRLLKWTSINKAVIVNNWMLSTNLYPVLSAEQLGAITIHIKERFPDHAIAFRSLIPNFDSEFDSVTNNDLVTPLQKLGYQMVGSRQVYLFNPKSPNLDADRTRRMNRMLKQDFRLFSTKGYEVINNDDIQASDIPRIVELYNALYLEKYSYNNPQFNQRCLELMRSSLESEQSPFLTLKALRKNGQIDAVVGFYVLNGVMTTPLLGYDTRLPKNLGLYRMLTALLIKEGNERGLVIHQSSGAASFKWRRGFSAWVECSGLFHQHLPIHRRLGWWFLGNLVDFIAIPLMKRYKL
ncbi:MAG: GNAT family N-acetyltransferase [Cyanobacteria bacterium J06634_5]